MKILIAYDGSSCADSALEDLRRAGLPRLAEAAVLSVSELWMPVLESVGAGEVRIVGALPVLLEKAEPPAQRACERVQSYFPDWTVRAEARSGSPASVIIERADEWRPDLIVVGSHGRSALGRFMLGSVPQKVVTEAHCSARVARGRGSDFEAPARLLIGVDGSPDAEAAITAVATRVWAKKLNRGGNPLAKITALGVIILLISAAAYLGSAAYREVEQARRLNEGQDRRLAQLEEQISRNSQQLSSLAQSNKDLLANLSLPTKLSNDFNNGVCLISGSYVFIDPDTGLPLRGMKKPKGESGEAEQPQFTAGGSGEIAEVFYTGTGFHVGDGYLLTNRHVVVEPWRYDALSYLFSKIISVQPRLVKLEAFFPGRRRSYQLTVKRASSRDDVAVCKLSGVDAPKDIPSLPLDQGAEPVKIGQDVTTMSFPAGADRPMSILPEGDAKRLLEQYGEEGPSLLNQLARRNIVKPLTSQGHVMDLYEDRIVYDAASGEGSSGAPVFGPSGRVIGIHFGYFEQNRLSNYAVPIGRGLALLRQAGWEPVN